MTTPKEFLDSYVENFNTRNLDSLMESKVKGVIQTSNLALVNAEWSFKGTAPDGKPINISGRATDILRQQPDSTWRVLIDNPWGTDL